MVTLLKKILKHLTKEKCAYQKSCQEKNKRIRQLNQKSRNLQLKIDTLNKLVDNLEKRINPMPFVHIC